MKQLKQSKQLGSRGVRSLVLCLGLGFGVALSAAAQTTDVVVIVHKDNLNQIDAAYVAQIYTGVLKGWPDGTPVFTLDQMEDAPARKLFYTQIVGKSAAAMKAIWSQNIFAGKGLPPKIASPDAEMKRLVATNRNAIGYVLASQVDASVRVIGK
ncbi:phosphate ABC transporter substrate-binding protein [Sphaerotilus sp.]|uniref:phosphate ABC transporter substrate-binding protein n=1 Tax=Sphaerotilus sp. TaxID=2093942 RepID=UPI002ACDA7EF|nr:phosphate ABC transporter substrate-binding protein [Sphaerotilus sp.]MDZ7857332.1 phosphate ABC transporter substrate-binding protein [Sphaerotilus sp.]